MKLSCSVFAGIFFSIAILYQAQAQFPPDSLLFKESISNLQQIYLNEVGDNAQIYHGTQYIRNGQKAIGFPFYESENMLDGSVSYQGIIYKDAKLSYDLVTDELITNNFTHDAQIVLAPLKTDSFRIGNHIFIRLSSEKNNGLPRDGYYEQLYSGIPGLYAKREKKLESGSGSEEAKYVQYNSNSYYIKMDTVYYNVDGKSSLLDVLKDKASELKKYIRSNKLNFKKNLESSLVLSTVYYSQLKH